MEYVLVCKSSSEVTRAFIGSVVKETTLLKTHPFVTWAMSLVKPIRRKAWLISGLRA
jgi:hypothetical protein